MDRRRFLTMATLSTVLGAAAPALADLKEYLARPESVYKWEKRGERKAPGGTVYDLHLVSQTWQGIVWTHRLQLFYPDKPARADFCTLLNTGGGGSNADDLIGITVAQNSGSPFAILHHIPNQPLYGGKVEDELIVHTWVEFVKSGDESWPLHFPMAKAVLKAMDALQAFAAEASLPALERFLITGASKRGWTTWLVGASRDKRVAAIAPMVIDVLNVPKQLAHQIESYGKPSEQVGDYTAVGIDKLLASPRGKRLMELEDPYSYRDILTVPKLLILGTNDRYWSQDSLNLYWDDLKGDKWVLYTPNSGHGLEDRGRVLATLSAFARATAAKRRWPRMRWQFEETPTGARLSLRSDQKLVSARLFHVASQTLDFRDSKWSSQELTVERGRVEGSFDTPASGCAAFFIEATYDLDGKPFTLSTQLRILGKPVKSAL